MAALFIMSVALVENIKRKVKKETDETLIIKRIDSFLEVYQ